MTFSTSRRTALKLGLGALVATTATGALTACATESDAAPAPSTDINYSTKAILLGTAGGPPPMSGRSGIGSAVVVDDKTYLVDLGHGSFNKIHQAGIDATSISAIFVTHLHSDHIAELYTLPFLRHGGIRSLTGPVQIYGPGRAGALPNTGQDHPLINPENPTPGTVDFIEKSMEATAYDLNIRIRDENWPDIRTVINTHDIAIPEVGADPLNNRTPAMAPFLVFEDEHVRVTAILVDHPPVFPAFAFRFDTADGSIVFSGDATICDNMVRIAQDADYLVHEVINLDWVASTNAPDELIEHLRASHADVDAIGALAERAGVKTLVLNHLVPGDPSFTSNEEWKRRAQQGFSGQVIVGEDLAILGLPDNR
ncbi:MBL fold metallo-hydrolase [Rhodococcus rhodochrous]|uniref:MBL fold metallo-hydrolase n=1 Tax=Rhodococcus rhodochrous TaxID=1829 RepID=UPI0002F508B8|nr:MBL fold metallo-hydrolase [Rhodococcus rhodochrous]